MDSSEESFLSSLGFENALDFLKSNPNVFEFDLFRHNLAYNYFDIAKSQVIALRATLVALEENAAARDSAESHEEESDLWQRSDELNAAKDRSALVAIVFSAMCLEAIINDFGSMLSSQSFFKRHLDNLKPETKWLMIPAVTVGQSIPTDSQAFELLSRLFKLRNKLVHFKPRTVSFKDRESWDRYTAENELMIEAAFEAMRAVFAATAELRVMHEGYSPHLDYFDSKHHPALQEYA